LKRKDRIYYEYYEVKKTLEGLDQHKDQKALIYSDKLKIFQKKL